MNKLFIFIVGAAVGSIVTWKLVKDKYEKIADDAIEDVKRVFSKRKDNSKELLNQASELLNEVYDMLGIPRTKAGQIVGWIYVEDHPNGDNFVDFGIYDMNREKVRDFVNGYERTILLDFNVDGNILNLI